MTNVPDRQLNKEDNKEQPTDGCVSIQVGPLDHTAEEMTAHNEEPNLTTGIHSAILNYANN